jgi:hypothetical protein
MFVVLGFIEIMRCIVEENPSFLDTVEIVLSLLDWFVNNVPFVLTYDATCYTDVNTCPNVAARNRT